ncbi:MAG: hypothetical protein U0441_22470 [Polyangiaceae bacterium]
MMGMLWHLLPICVLAAGCGTTPAAQDVCAKLEAAGVARGCHEVKAEVINARARTKYDFDLVHVPGEGGAVLDFAKDDDYETTVKMYEAAAMFAGPHRYGNAKARVFVQMNAGASLEEGKQVKALVEGL